MSKQKQTHYNLRLPKTMYDEAGERAKQHGVSRLTMFLNYFKLGLLAEQIQENPDEELVIRKSDGSETRLVF